MNKRKQRGGANRERVGGGVRSNSTRTPDRDARVQENNVSASNAATHVKEECEGVYKNARFTHTVTSLIGNNIRVETQNNIEFEGILQTFSPQFEMVLEWVHQIDPKMPDCINHETVKEKMVFPLRDIVQYYAVDVDLNFATKEEFQTDTQISNKFNGEAPMRELEQWMPDAGDDDMVDIEVGGGNSNGWSAHEMFAKNKEFGVETSYDPNLSGYTTQLNRNSENSAEWKEREKQAAMIAAEIEGNSNSLAAVELENGDEEEAFSAVVRDTRASPGQHDTGDKPYVPPGRRDTGGGRGAGGRGGKGARTTPPGNDDYRGNNRGYDRSYSGNSRGGYSNDRDRYERPDYRNRGYDNHSRDGHRQGPGDRDRPSPGYKKEDNKKTSPLRDHEKPVDRKKSGEGLPQRSPGGADIDSANRLGKKTREQQNSELKEFQDNFQLAAGPPAGGSKSPTSTTPRVSVKQGSQNNTPLPSPQPGSGAAPEMTTPAPPDMSSPPAPADVSGSPPSSSSTPLSDSVKKSTLNPNAKEFSLNPTAKEFTPRGPARVNPTPPRPQTPNTPNSMAAMAAGIPQAFSQGGYITIAPAPGQMAMTQMTHVNNGMFVPTQPYPMMGQPNSGAGQPMASIAAGQPGQPPQPQMNVNPPYIPSRPGPSQGNHARQGGKEPNNNGGQGRPDLPSPLQVTGHPILAGGTPGHQFVTGYPAHQPQIYPGQPPQGPQVVRMIMPGGVHGNIIAGPGIVPVMSQADSGGNTGNNQNMWTGGQSQHHPPQTPPQHGTQPNTPAPSPGLQQMYSGPPHHQPPSYQAPGQQNMVIIPNHGAGGFPQHIPTSVPQPHAHIHAHGGPNIMGPAGPVQPTTSMSGGMMPQYHYIPQHQGGAQAHITTHMMPQHNQQ